MIRRCQAPQLEVSWLTQYGGESLQTVNLPTAPRIIANISNSLMTAAPSYLDDAIYLQRRSNFTSNYTQYNGIGETSQEWLRADRVSINQEAVVVVAVRESVFPGAGEFLTGLGWTAIGQTITMGYNTAPANLQLYAGLVDAGLVQISGAWGRRITHPRS